MQIPFDPRIILRQTPLPVPVWAQQLVEKIADEHNIKPPVLEFYRGPQDGGGGGWYHDKRHELVVITQFDMMSDLLTIVHEMSHAIADLGHTPKMYEKMLELVEQFKLDKRLAIRQEMEYMPVPFVAAYRRYIEKH